MGREYEKNLNPWSRQHSLVSLHYEIIITLKKTETLWKLYKVSRLTTLT